MFLSCQQPLTAASVTASKENCIHPISSKFLLLPYLQALSNCSSYLPFGNWKCLGTDQRSHQAPLTERGWVFPFSCFFYLMVQWLHFQTQDSWVPPTDKSFSSLTSPILIPLMSECHLLQNLQHFCTASQQYHSNKAERMPPFHEIFHCVLATSTPLQGISFITVLKSQNKSPSQPTPVPPVEQDLCSLSYYHRLILHFSISQK